MSILKIVTMALISLSAVLAVRAYKPEMAMQISIAAGVVILISVLSELTGLVDAVDRITQMYGLDRDIIKVVIKVIGIAYLTQFASQACKDAGEGAIAVKVELAGRVLIVTASLPALMKILDLLSSLLVKQ